VIVSVTGIMLSPLLGMFGGKASVSGRSSFGSKWKAGGEFHISASTTVTSNTTRQHPCHRTETGDYVIG